MKETTRQSSQDGLLAHVDKVKIDRSMSVSTLSSIECQINVFMFLFYFLCDRELF